MLSIIGREEYWRWIDERIVTPARHDLKTIQDAYILSELASVKGKKILEVGGGNSRIAALLAHNNEVWLADGFEGKDGGPGEIPQIPNVKMIQAYLGDYPDQLPDNYFDVVFSISVVEHIPQPKYIDFTKDSARVLKSGGLAIHAIDIYLYDNADFNPSSKFQQKRIELYLKTADETGGVLTWTAVPELTERQTITSSAAYNSMETLIAWNKFAPSIIKMRAEAVSCSLKMKLMKR
ncbi:hypothetical protein BH10PSE7_BH10PSE7_25820 [soil metagenome]